MPKLPIQSRFCVFVLAAVTSPSSASEPVDILGDVDGNDSINVADLLSLRQALDGLLELPADASARADVDTSGVVDEEDFDLLTLPALSGVSGAVFQNGLPVISAIQPAFAPEGEVIAIGGLGFGDSPVVTVGGVVVPSFWTSWSDDDDDEQDEQIGILAPADSGMIEIFNAESEQASAGYPLVVAEGNGPDLTKGLVAGDVLIATPGEVPLPNSFFTVPIAVGLGEAPLGCVGVMVEFDPNHVRVCEVIPHHPEYLTPLPPCIDNAGGVLGAGALRESLAAAPVSVPAIQPLLSVVFECVNYRPYVPDVCARVDVVGDTGFPASPIGAPTPRFALRASSQFDPPYSISLPESVGVDEIEQVVTVDAVTEEWPGIVRVTVDGQLPLGLGPHIVVFHTGVGVTVQTSSLELLSSAPTGLTSGPVTVFSLASGAVAIGRDFVVQESDLPTLEATSPPAGVEISQTPDLLLVFSEVLDETTLLTNGLRFDVDAGAGFVQMPFSASITPYGKTTVRIRPAAPLGRGALVRLTLPPGLADLSGNPLEPIAPLEFVVGD